MLENKVVLITGAGKGIGEAIAKTLAKAGAILLLNARTLSDLEQVKADILAATPNAQVALFAGDVSNFNFVKQTVEYITNHYKRLDVLINNAGVCPPFVLLQEFSQADIDNTIDINLKGPLYWMHAAIPPMVHQGGGVIININSIAGKVAYPYSSVYCATKFGLHALTESISLEQRQNNIKVIGIYPGEVKTPIWDTIEPNVTQNPELMLASQDIADAVQFVLTQPTNAWVKDITVLPLKAPDHG